MEYLLVAVLFILPGELTHVLYSGILCLIYSLIVSP